MFDIDFAAESELWDWFDMQFAAHGSEPTDADEPGLIDSDEWEPIPADAFGAEVLIGPDDPIVAVAARSVDDLTLRDLNIVPLSMLSSAGRSQKLVQLERVATYVDSQRIEAIAMIAGPPPQNLTAERDDFAPEEIAVAGKCSTYLARALIATARDLAHRLTDTMTALREGRITLAQATALSEATTHLDLATAREIEAKLLKYSGRQNLANFRTSLRKWRAKLDPDFTRRATEARAQAMVDHQAGDDGTGSIYLRGPLEITSTIYAALQAYATKTKPTLGGTVAQRMVAGLRDWAEEAWNAPDTPRHHGRLPTVNVVIDLPTLLGMRNHPAVIPGVGSIPADAVRWLLADGAPFRRLVTDPLTGRLLDFGRDTYTVPPPLSDFLIAQTVTSATPHTTIPAEGCDMEHNTPFDNRHGPGGHTDPINCTPMARRWHRAKTHAGWWYEKDPETAVVTWHSPSGLTCEIPPYDYNLAI